VIDLLSVLLLMGVSSVSLLLRGYTDTLNHPQSSRAPSVPSYWLVLD